MSPSLRRRTLMRSIGRFSLFPVVGSAGCIDFFGGEPGVTFKLQTENMTQSEIPKGYSLVDFDTSELPEKKRRILDEACTTGTYVEEHVNWSPNAPRRETISPAFKSILNTLCDHSEKCTHPMNQEWRAYLRYKTVRYQGRIQTISPGD